jgi:hypothetical protein
LGGDGRGFLKESRPIKWQQCRVSTRKNFFCLHIHSLWPCLHTFWTYSSYYLISQVQVHKLHCHTQSILNWPTVPIHRPRQQTEHARAFLVNKKKEISLKSAFWFAQAKQRTSIENRLSLYLTENCQQFNRRFSEKNAFSSARFSG